MSQKNEAGKLDSEMYLHHSIFIILQSISLYSGYNATSAMSLTTFGGIADLFRYIRDYTKASSWQLYVDSSFFVTFTVCRIFLYSHLVHRSWSVREVVMSILPDERKAAWDISLFSAFLLTLLNYYWFIKICNIGYKMLT